jgi:O-antigen ligase
LLCFVGLLFLSALNSSLYPDQQLPDLITRIKNWMIYSIFLGLAFTHVRDRRQKLFVTAVAFVMITFTAADSVSSTLANEGLAANPLRHRAGGLVTPQPNIYAGFLAMYLFFFIGFLTQYPLSLRGKAIVAAGTALVVLNLVYTFSRGAWLAAAAAALFISGAKSRRALVPVLAILAAVYLWAPEAAVSRFESGFQGEYDPALLLKEDTDATEAASRIIQWRSFLPMLSANPLLGVGLGRYAREYYEAGHDVKLRSAHSSIIEIAVENGVFAIICYFWILWVIYRRASTVFRASDDPLERSLALGVVGATVALLLLDVTGTRFRNGDIIVLYWIFAGMVLNSYVRLPAPSATPTPALLRHGPVGRTSRAASYPH